MPGILCNFVTPLSFVHEKPPIYKSNDPYNYYNRHVLDIVLLTV